MPYAVWGHAPSADAEFSVYKEKLLEYFCADCRQQFARLKFLTFSSAFILHRLMYVKTNQTSYSKETVIITSPEIVVICFQITIDYLEGDMVLVSVPKFYNILPTYFKIQILKYLKLNLRHFLLRRFFTASMNSCAAFLNSNCQ